MVLGSVDPGSMVRQKEHHGGGSVRQKLLTSWQDGEQREKERERMGTVCTGRSYSIHDG
jgi:hypothetical protein